MPKYGAKQRKQITALRKDYSLEVLDESSVDADPFKQFQAWFNDAVKAELKEPNAMALATSSGNKPSVRMVLLKGFDSNGFIFYTNYKSQKGKEITSNRKVALLFFWNELERQVRIEGQAKKISKEDSKHYFESRPRAAQIGALASNQSQAIPNRGFLEAKFKEIEKQYAQGTIPCPSEWGGYIVKPISFEFWQGRENRLHDRIKYKTNKRAWQIIRLSP